MNSPVEIQPAQGKLGVLLPGMGAVSTTFIAGCMLARRQLALPIGSLSQMGTVRIGPHTDAQSPRIRDYVPLASLDDLVFGGWDLFADNAYEAACAAEVLSAKHLAPIADELRAVKPMPAVFFPEYVRRLRGENVKPETHRRDLVAAVRQDIRDFRAKNGLERCVAIWCGSTEIHAEAAAVHTSLALFEAGLEANDTAISPSMIYAYACLKEGVPYANGAPNLTTDIPALLELALAVGMPVSGKDFKTGQTLIKTVLAPGLKARMLGVRGWFSTNILGNRDGEVLDDPASFRSKEVSKLGVLESILEPERFPDLYGDMYHKVRIEYYPPRGDQKEGWDNLDLTGWLGYPMQMKIDFLCRDSILAAPIVLDLALFTDLAVRSGLSWVQNWLSFFYKSPMTVAGEVPVNDLFVQLMKFKNTLRWLRGAPPVSEMHHEHYD